MTLSTNGREQTLVVVGEHDGLTLIPSPTPLSRLNFFDGKFLRADDLRAEQDYVRHLVELSNQAGGAGVVHGFDTTRGPGDSIQIGDGMAIDGEGRVLLLPRSTSVSFGELLEASRRTPAGSATRATGRAEEFGDCEKVAASPPSDVPLGSDLYVITIGHAEGLCGEEDVYGRLCEEACITSTDRPHRLEGVVVRARSLRLQTPLAASGAVALDRRHLRSLVASAFFADEAALGGDLISGEGLRLSTWCLGADRTQTSGEVPLAVVSRSGASIGFLDAWTVRRERMDSVGRRYWAWRMRMRPWDVFMAQVLQFQCQLHALVERGGEAGDPDDPCAPHHNVLGEATKLIADVEDHYAGFLKEVKAGTTAREVFPGGITRIAAMRELMGKLLTELGPAAPRERVLISRGVVELPSAGYLPVVAGTTLTVNGQVRRLLGEGVDLRYCIVRPDFVAHALEEAQHMERISLLQGLDRPGDRPAVDVLVPDGEIVRIASPPPGRGFEGVVRIAPRLLADERANQSEEIHLREPIESAAAVHGAGRAEGRDSGGGAFHFAGATEVPQRLRVADLAVGIQVFTDTKVDKKKLDTFMKMARAEPGPSPDIEDPDMASRIAVLAAEAADATRSMVDATAATTTRVEPATEAFEPSTRPGQRRPVAVWASMAADRDPFGLESSGERVATHIVADIAMPAASPSRVTFELRGSFQLGPALRHLHPDERRVRGRFTGVGLRRSVVDGDADEDTGAVKLDVTLIHRTSPGEPPSLRAVLRPVVSARDRQEALFMLGAEWGGSPLGLTVEAEGAVVRGTPAQREAAIEEAIDRLLESESLGGLQPSERGEDVTSFSILNAGLEESPAVMEAGNAVHRLALSALDILEASLADPGYADANGRLLFPPAARPPEELTVRATRDWVLFQRRRDKRCDRPEERPPAAPPRTYRLWHLQVKSLEHAEAVRHTLRTGDAAAVTRLALRPVDDVEFAAGLPALVSSPGDVRSDLQAVQPGNRLQYAAIASTGADDGAALGHSRLLRLEDALAPLVPADQAAIAETLPGLPEPLVTAGTDGAIVVLTRTVTVARTCHTVYRLDPELTTEIDRLEDKRELVGLLSANEARDLAVAIGAVEFEAHGADIVSGDDEVARTWTQAGGGSPAQVFVLSREGNAATGDEALRQRRGRAIAGALGKAVGASAHEVEADLPGDCPAVTLLLPELPQEQDTVCEAVHGIRSVDPQRSKQIEGFVREGNLGRLEVLVPPLGTAVFVVGSADLVGEPRVEDISGPTEGAPQGFVAVFVDRTRAPDEPQGVLKDRAVKIADLVFPTAGAGLEFVLVEVGTNWPEGVDCPYITMVAVLNGTREG